MSQQDIVGSEQGTTPDSTNTELSHHQYELNNKLLVRNCKHLQNKHQQHESYEQHLKRNSFQYKQPSSKEDYDHNSGNNNDELCRGLSLESYNSLYQAESNNCPHHQQQQRQQQQHFNSSNNLMQKSYGVGNLNGSASRGMAGKGSKVNGLNAVTSTATLPHIIYNDDSFETHITHAQHHDNHDVVEGNEDVDIDNMAKTTLASNKTYKKFVLPLDIPTPPLPLSNGYNKTKRLLSSHNSNHLQTSSSSSTSCQCDKQTNFTPQNGNQTHKCTANNNNIKNQVNHISFIQTTNYNTSTAPPSKKENLTLLHNKGSSSSSTLSGSIGCSGHNFNLSDQHHHLPYHEPLQHHHLCQQKNAKLQHLSQQHPANAHHQHQHHQLPQCQQQLPAYDAYASQQYLPQLPQLLSINSNKCYNSNNNNGNANANSNSNNYQQNSLTLSHRHMAPTFNRIADKNYMKNLVYAPEKLRRIRIILCIVGGILLLSLLCTALYFIISNSEDVINDDNNGTPMNGIHLEEVLQGKLLAKHFNGSWSGDHTILYKENNAIMEYDVLTKLKTRLLLDTNQQYISYEKSADGNYLLLAKNYKKNFRHSFLAEYDIYDIDNGQLKPLEIQGQAKSLNMVQWAPVGSALIINYERNLYYKASAFSEEIPLTDDITGVILNGIPDWVYEEEVFSSNSAVWFSPDGKKLAFLQFDDSPTQVINFPVYGEAGDLRFQYPLNRLVAYPKAGSPNPRVKLFTSDLVRAAAGNTDHLTNVPVPSALNTEGDYIVTVVDWLNNTTVLSVWMNRVQNQAHVQVFNGLRRQELYSLESKTGWVDFFSPPFKNRDGTRVAFILPLAQTLGPKYRHLCILSTGSFIGHVEPLTKGHYVVTSILHWDTTHDIIFYTANTERKPQHMHVYAIKAATGQTAQCLTCNLHKSNGKEQTYYSADFSTKNHVIINSLGPSIPQTMIYEWTYSSNQVNLRKIVTWENNDHLRSILKDRALPTIEIDSIPIADDFTAEVLMQLPPNMDRTGKTKYPMLVDVYGGPDSYSVVDKWIMDWGTFLSSNQSVIYVKIDGRGSGLRGEKLLHSVYLKLGTVEIDDQIDVAKKLQKKYNFIDANHTGIWGWSYGGYAAAMALANDDDHVFRCAASIAPVTDWTYYDSIYTERYMGLPTLNELGYSASRLSTKAVKLKGKKFLLVHGTLDDNVHYQQSMILAKNLERHDILFKQISYPDEDHALGGVRPHLYHSLDKFFGECFAQSRLAHSK